MELAEDVPRLSFVTGGAQQVLSAQDGFAKPSRPGAFVAPEADDIRGELRRRLEVRQLRVSQSFAKNARKQRAGLRVESCCDGVDRLPGEDVPLLDKLAHGSLSALHMPG